MVVLMFTGVFIQGVSVHIEWGCGMANANEVTWAELE
jgi:hypothetical protein